MRYTLRPYQQSAIDKARALFKQGIRRFIIVAPTGCLAGDTIIDINRAGKSFKIKLADLVARFNGGSVMGKTWRIDIPTTVRSYGQDKAFRLSRLRAAYESGIKQTHTLTTSDGHHIRATADHRFLTDRGWLRLSEVCVGDRVFVENRNRKTSRKPKRWDRLVNGLRAHPHAGRRGVKSDKGGYSVPFHRLVCEARINDMPVKDYVLRIRSGLLDGLHFINPRTHHVHHIDEDHKNNAPENLEVVTPAEHMQRHADDSYLSVAFRSKTVAVSRIEPYGYEPTYDLELEGEPHNFLANGIVVHNSGKTTIAASLIESAVAKGGRCIFLAHTTELIEQCSLRLDSIGVDHGIIKANHPRARPWAPVQIASVQTLVRRETRPEADVLFQDEAHRGMAKSYRVIAEEYYPKAALIGLTATPWRLDGKGLLEVYEDLIIAAKPSELIEQGFIMDPRVLAPPTVSLDGLRVVRGDYDSRELDDCYRKSTVTGDIVAHWEQHACNRPTIVFACSVAHAREFQDAFRLRGIDCGHVSGETPPPERAHTLSEFAQGRLSIVTCADVLTEGYDLPSLGCVVLARPTKSLTKYLQMVGRALRPCLDKPQPLVLDHAGCFHEHGWPTLDRNYALEASRPNKPPDLYTVCSACFAVIPKRNTTCPECGASLVAPSADGRSGPENIKGSLIEVTRSDDYRGSLNLDCPTCGAACMLAYSRPGKDSYKLLCPVCRTDKWRNKPRLNATPDQKVDKMLELYAIAERKIQSGEWTERTGLWWRNKTYKEIFGVRAPRTKRDKTPNDTGENTSQ